MSAAQLWLDNSDAILISHFVSFWYQNTSKNDGNKKYFVNSNLKLYNPSDIVCVPCITQIAFESVSFSLLMIFFP